MLTKHFKSKKSGGFTLIEILISVGVFALLVGFSLSIIYSTIRSTSKSQAAVFIEQNSSTLLMKMRTDIERSYFASAPSSDHLILKYNDTATGNSHQVDYYIKTTTLGSRTVGYITRALDSGTEKYLFDYGNVGGVGIEPASSGFSILDTGSDAVRVTFRMFNAEGASLSTNLNFQSFLIVNEVIVLRGAY